MNTIIVTYVEFQGKFSYPTEIQFYDRIVKARMADTWSAWSGLESTRPIVRSTIEVLAPPEMPLQNIALKYPIEGTVTFDQSKAEGRIVYRWVARDVPRMFPEPRMPEAYTVVQRLLASTVPDWETVSRWYWNLSEPHFAATDKIRAKVVELVGGLTEESDIIDAIFKFVSQDIRYMGITVEADAPG